MPTLATGSKQSSEAGFSLVELLAVLAILSLMVGAVVFNLPEGQSETNRFSASLEAKLSRFLSDGAVAGEMRALGLDDETLVLYQHDGLTWQPVTELNWPEAARIGLELGEETLDLSEPAQPILFFEPYGAVPDFVLSLQDREADYRLSADERGRIVRTIDR